MLHPEPAGEISSDWGRGQRGPGITHCFALCGGFIGVMGPVFANVTCFDWSVTHHHVGSESDVTDSMTSLVARRQGAQALAMSAGLPCQRRSSTHLQAPPGPSAA